MTDFERHVLGMEEGVVLSVAALSMLRCLFVVSFGNPIVMPYGLLRFFGLIYILSSPTYTFVNGSHFWFPKRPLGLILAG